MFGQEPEHLDDLKWSPDSAEDEATISMRCARKDVVMLCGTQNPISMMFGDVEGSLYSHL